MYLFKKRSLITFLLLLPILLFYTITVIVPVTSTLPLSLYKWDMMKSAKFIGLKNFIFLFSDPNFYRSLINTLVIMIVGNLILLTIGFILAVLLRRRFFGNDFFKVMIFIPIIVAPIIAALIWGFILEPVSGLINVVLNKIGLSMFALSWIGSKYLSIFVISGVLAWAGMGINMTILLAGVRSINTEIFEAAEIDGASRFQRTFFITLPLVRNQILICLILNITGGLKVFELGYFLTKGGPGHATELISTYMYKMGFSAYNFGYGTAIAVIILILGLLMSFLSIKIFETRQN